MKKIEIEKFAQELFAQQKTIRERNIVDDKIQNEFKTGKLILPIPLWKTKTEEIDISLQADSIHPKLLEKGISIIENVSVELLLSKFTKADQRMFKSAKLYGPKFIHTKTSTVLDFWIKGEKLIPPTICVYNKEYMQLVCPGGEPTRELRPIDGKHRLSTALNCNVTVVPILVPTFQLEIIKTKLFGRKG